MRQAIPQRLQSILWSSDVSKLDSDKNKTYIIHQILSHGRMEDILWIFSIYPKKIIQESFINHPFKEYEAARFYFIKKYLLNLDVNPINEKNYVKNTPRNIG